MNPELVNAIRSGDVKALQELIDKGISLKQTTDRGLTPLLLAAGYGQVAIVKYLLDNHLSSPAERVPPGRTPPAGSTPLLFAAAYGKVEVVKYLLENHLSSPTEKDASGFTALLMATINGHTSVIDYLLKNNHSSITEKDNLKRTALLLAAGHGNIPLVEHLVENKYCELTETNEEGNSAIMMAAMSNQLPMLQYLLNKNPSLINSKDIDGTTVLIAAASAGHVALVDYLLKNKLCDITERNNRGNTALLIAAVHGHLPMVQTLLENTSASANEKNVDERTVLLLAAGKGHIPIVEYLLKKKLSNMTERDKYGNTAFLLAIGNDQQPMAKYLLKNGLSDLSEKDNNGFSALIKVSINESGDLIRFLLKRGVYLDLPCNNGLMPLQMILAQYEGLKDKKMEPVSLPVLASEILLDMAEGKNKYPDVEKILDILGDSLNARRYESGNTALHWAILTKNRKLMIRLLDEGADVTLPNKEGMTPEMLLEKLLLEEEKAVHEEMSLNKLHIESLIRFSKLKKFSSMEIKRDKEIKDAKESKEVKDDKENREFILFLRNDFIESWNKLKPPYKEVIGLRFYHFISDPNFCLYDESFSNTFLQKIHPRFRKNGQELEDSLANVFKESQFHFSLMKSAKDLVLCMARVPPKTAHILLRVTSNGFKVYNSTSDVCWKNLEEFGESWLEVLRRDVNYKKRTFLLERQGLDIKRISESTESSMRQLSVGQLGIMEAVRKKYEARMKELGGRDAVLKDFKEYLEYRFGQNPPEYNGKKLPLEYDKEMDSKDIKDSKDSKESEESKDTKDNKDIRELYYTNPFHTAWRYLINPNPWIDPDARYAVKTAGRATHADITEQAKTDLAYLWLAASDDSFIPIRDMTLDTMMDNFVLEIAYINRGHNWDALDAMVEGIEKEKLKEEMRKKWDKIVDDLKPDNPSCNMGVNQRLMQSICGNPITETKETRALDAGIVRNKVAELIATRFNEYLEKKTVLEIKDLLSVFEKKCVLLEDISEKEKKLLEEFKLTTEDIEKLIDEMIKSYGDRFIFQEMRTDTEHYFSFEEYARKLAFSNPWDHFSERLLGIAHGRLERIPKVVMIKKKDKDVAAPAVLHAFSAAVSSSGDTDKEKTEKQKLSLDS